eukprot:GFYU01000778.1.p1 GENE.GFYU01000778.1~~GFYU01000778.1.p1  ORF type:complete len:352 (+),score=90.31 GFYU01000778.1:112-1167(+)
MIGGDNNNQFGNMQQNPGFQPQQNQFGSSPYASPPASGNPAFGAQGGQQPPQPQAYAQPQQGYAQPQQGYAQPQQGYGGQPQHGGQPGMPGQEYLQNPMMQFGLAQGQQFLGAGLSNVQSNFANYVGDSNAGLKCYFNVSNSYVVNKLKVLLCPYIHKSWPRRRSGGEGDQAVYLPPRDDVNAPDLYIPLMAFVTYVLLVGYALGTAGAFTPDQLGGTGSTGIVVCVLEILAVKLGFYLLNARRLPWLDILAYSGYKYVGIVVNLIVGLMLGSFLFWTVYLYNSVSSAFFMIKTLRRLLFPEAMSPHEKPAETTQRNYFLFGLAILQLPISWFLASGITDVTAVVKEAEVM